MIEENITHLLQEKFKEEAFEDCFLVELTLNNTKLNIYIDSDSGVTFQKCQQISRYLEQYLDEEQWLGERYTLEVSSPGVGRPLRLKRQYAKNLDRKVEVKRKDGAKEEGVLKAVTQELISLERKARIQEGKKKKTVIQRIDIPFEDIKETIVKISF